MFVHATAGNQLFHFNWSCNGSWIDGRGLINSWRSPGPILNMISHTSQIRGCLRLQSFLTTVMLHVRNSECPIYSSYKCQMGLCMSLRTWCDGKIDCPDNSDELPGCNTSECLSNTFHSCTCCGHCEKTSTLISLSDMVIENYCSVIVYLAWLKLAENLSVCSYA
jgi:Low-density lipoprotein receptor domain class A